MRKSGTRFISAALAACMMASVLPVNAFALGGGGTATDPESSISTQAAVTGTVLKGGETIRNGANIFCAVITRNKSSLTAPSRSRSTLTAT